jgi:nicotinate dehydrogenase subunit A
MTVNGLPHTLDVAADTPLIFVLREELGLMSAKLGCGLEQCGACLVLVDGSPVYACTAVVGDFADREVLTLEGLSDSVMTMHPLQQAFVDENAAQCGYCMSGVLMRAKALLDVETNPSRDRICAALDGHLCRCGAQPRMIRAVQRAAARMRVEP